MSPRDAIVIGAGVNGLVAATLLAKRGLKPLVLEAAEQVGGCAITSEIAPGFRCPTLSHWAALDPGLVRALDLERHGLQIIASPAIGCAAPAGGPALVLWNDTARTVAGLEAASRADAARYPEFERSLSALGGVLRRVLSAPAPSMDRPAAGDLFELLKTGRQFRGLGRADAYRLLRWLPMPVADFATEWFETPPLQAAIAAGGVFGSFLGPRSAGSTAVFLLMAARHDHPMAAGWTARGGTGAIASALASAARAAGAEIRTSARVKKIAIRDEAAAAVVLETGEEIAARRILSSADPRRTFLGLVDPAHLPHDFREAVRQIRMRGTLAKINFAVSAMPAFSGLARLDAGQQAAALSGWIRLSPSINAIERAFDAAKYGGVADEPAVELSIPSITDPGLAPAGKHVVSAYVQFAPAALRNSSWAVEKERLGTNVARLIDRAAPGFEASIVDGDIISPADLEETYGLTGGQIFHGEIALDQLYLARPLLGWARYQTPIRNLYLCGSGTHPGTGLDGRAGRLAAQEVLRANRRPSRV